MNPDLSEEDQQKFELIDSTLHENPQQALVQLRELTKTPKLNPQESGFYEFDPVYDAALSRLLKCYAFLGDSKALVSILSQLRPHFSQLSKSKRENLVKSVFSLLYSIPNTMELQINLCKEYVEYFNSDENKRPLLKMFFETKLAALLVDTNQPTKALEIVSTLQTAMKKLDDKLLLVEINLIESQAQYTIRNIPKARSTLTAARTNANQVYVPVDLQAEIDMQSGVLSSHENDFKTAFSYFLESLDGFSTVQKDGGKKKAEKTYSVYQLKALRSFRFMLLCKLMDEDFVFVQALLLNKHAADNKFDDDAIVKLLVELTESVKERNLEVYSKTYEAFLATKQLEGEVLIKTQLDSLKDNLLEKNILKIITPYSRVEVERVAELIKLDEEAVMTKISQMILDKKLNGILDQGAGELIIHDEVEAEEKAVLGDNALNLVENLETVVNTLIKRARSLHVV